MYKGIITRKMILPRNKGGSVVAFKSEDSSINYIASDQWIDIWDKSDSGDIIIKQKDSAFIYLIHPASNDTEKLMYNFEQSGFTIESRFKK